MWASPPLLNSALKNARCGSFQIVHFVTPNLLVNVILASEDIPKRDALACGRGDVSLERKFKNIDTSVEKAPSPKVT